MAMANKETREKKKLYFVGYLVNYSAELKLVLTTLFLLCVVATLLQFLPSRFTISTSDLRFCISRLSTPSTPSTPSAPLSTPYTPLSTPSTLRNDTTTIIKRAFNAHGSAAYNLITMGAYRGGLNTFAIIALSSKPLHVYGKPTYKCEWVPSMTSSSSKPLTTKGLKYLPDWGYGHVYTVVVVNCTFNATVLNADNAGGKLLLHASTSGAGDTAFNVTDTIEVLEESPGTFNSSVYTTLKPKYDYLYCGSSLFGNLNPQRVREWIAYHVRFFGPKSHFVIHDAGGVHEEVVEVLKPWMELGYVTLQDIREQERFDGYYHNQFMVVNDCLHRYKFMAKWMFFFDLDEYIYVPPKSTIKSVLKSLSEYDQFTIEQMPMSSKICLSQDNGTIYRKWGFEKLVFRDSITGIRRDRKYAVQPRSLYATGVHMSMDLSGKTTHKTEGRIKYFHYHGTISARRESCKILVNTTQVTHDKIPYVLDTTMRDIAGTIKKFELKMIGPRLKNTRQ